MITNLQRAGIYTLDIGKPFGMIKDIIIAAKEIINKTGVGTVSFEFNGKKVLINGDTEVRFIDIVLKAVADPMSRDVVDIRG